MVGDPCAGEVAAEAASAARTAEEIYNSNCMACHMTGASAAPILGNVEQWESRIANGMDTLYENAINGLNLMPAMGLCMTCSEEEIREVVDYMVEASQ
jgi:cytochrome c5